MHLRAEGLWKRTALTETGEETETKTIVCRETKKTRIDTSDARIYVEANNK